LNQAKYVVFGLLAAGGVAAAIWTGIFSDEVNVEDAANLSAELSTSSTENSQASPQSAVEDDGWWIYCAGQQASTYKVLNQEISKPAVFLALRLHHSETPKREEMLCQTKTLTSEFVVDKLKSQNILRKSFINFKIPMTIDGMEIKIRYTISSSLRYKTEFQEDKIKRYINKCDTDNIPDNNGIYYVFNNNDNCAAHPYRTDNNKISPFGYSRTKLNNEPVLIYCANKCSIQINFHNKLLRVVFPKNYLPIWRKIRVKALNTLSSRVILDYDVGSCAGDLCDAVQKGLK